MTDAALKAALERADDTARKREIGEEIARQAVQAAATTEERVSGATLAAEYGLSVRWWQDRLSKVRAELEHTTVPTSQTVPAEAASTEGRRDIGTPLADRNTPPPPTDNVGTLLGKQRAEPAPTFVPSSELSTLVGNRLGTLLADPPPDQAFARREDSPIGTAPAPPTHPSATGWLHPANSPHTPIHTTSETPWAPNQPQNGPERLSEPTGARPMDTADPAAVEELTATSQLHVAERGNEPTIGSAAPAVGTQVGTAHADLDVVSLPTTSAGTDTPPDSASPEPVGTRLGTNATHSASSSLPSIDTTSPVGTNPGDLAEAAMPSVADPAPRPSPAPAQLADDQEIARAAQLQYAFYGVAVVFALVGQVWAGVTIIEFPAGMPLLLQIAIVAPALAVIELAGVATSHQADLRRRLGEQAYGYRTLSLLAALVAAGFNLAGHWGDWFPAIGFTGLSVFAYCSWLMQSNARRRDALRAAGKLAATAPVYGVRQWLREPALTKQARTLAVEHGYGVHESLRVAREEARTELRRKALAAAIERRIIELHEGDEIGATIAATTYDLDRLAVGVEARLDYTSAEEFIAADLVLTRDRTGEDSR